MSTTAKLIHEAVKTLSEAEAREVLDFVEFLKTKRAADEDRRKRALATLAKYRGRFKAVKFDREELYDRPCLR
jgi:hypothetical protein